MLGGQYTLVTQPDIGRIIVNQLMSPGEGRSSSSAPKNPEYRAMLIAGEQKAQTDFDRTVMALSGGALGISFAFIEKVVGSGVPRSVGALKFAWVAWVVSLAAVLTSHYLSALAMRRALEQYDGGRRPGERVGGAFDSLTSFFNAAGGLAFLAGAAAAGLFVIRNLPINGG